MSDQLRQMPLFAAFSDEQLDELYGQARELSLNTGEVLCREGDAPQGLFVILDGGLDILKQVGAKQIVLAQLLPGDFVGEISLLTGQPHTATARASEPSRFLKFEPTLLDHLKTSPVISLLLGTMARRMRNTESVVRNHERLSTIGKLSAGLAQELDDPAVASSQAAKQLAESIAVAHGLALQLNALNLSPDQRRALDELQRKLIEREKQPEHAASQREREAELVTWLDSVGCIDSVQTASLLAGTGLDAGQLDSLRQQFDSGAFAIIIQWLEALVRTIGQTLTLISSATRIAEVINAVKAYTYMDQSPTQQVDIHDGLENTLIMLRHRLSNVQVVRDYDRSLPSIIVYGSEINQVWTNLIDNAIEAIGDSGTITLRTWRDNDWLVVEVADDGCGIAFDIQPKIFEPMYSPKLAGKAPGLGLDTVRRIVNERHHGMVRFRSVPGDTRFQVYLPIRAQIQT